MSLMVGAADGRLQGWDSDDAFIVERLLTVELSYETCPKGMKPSGRRSLSHDLAIGVLAQADLRTSAGSNPGAKP